MNVPLKPGDLILWPKDKAPGLYTVLLDWGRNVLSGITKNPAVASTIAKMLVDALAQSVKHEYIHVEITMLNNFLFGAWFNGTHLWKPSPEARLQLMVDCDIYRPVFPVDEDRLVEIAAKYRSRPYDFTSLILNTATEVMAFGNKIAERQLQQRFAELYNNKDALICSELVARIYEEMGYKIETESEYVTPDDIAQSPLFKKIK